MTARRSAAVVIFACLLAVSWRAVPQIERDRGARSGSPATTDELSRYERCRAMTRNLLTRFPHAIPQPGQMQLRETLQHLQAATGNWASARGASTELASRARDSAEAAMMRILAILDASPETIRVSQPDVAVRRRWPSRSNALILRVTQPGAETDIVPDFLTHHVEAGASASAIELPQARIVYAALLFETVPFGTGRLDVTLTVSRKQVAVVKVTTDVPAPGQLKVECIDAKTGRPSPAVIGLYASNNQIVAPSDALNFEQGGFRYQQEGFRYESSRVRPYQQMRYWPGGFEQQRVFFAGGRFAVELPEGDYTLIVAKGFEYVPQTKTTRVRANAERSEVIRLEPWIDMPGRGWYSGDGHVHYERESKEANERLLTWSKAEDVHVTNVMRMGDAQQIYFEQYAFGAKGRYIDGDYAIVPGQEDPRTSGMGHTLHMNLQAPIRMPEQYYLYDLVFDSVHRMGGLTGYAHVYQPAAMGFWVQRDMTMNIARKKIDFAEISEFGDIDSRLYYEFLNLGFRLAASAGSDVPWGHSIGTSRVYAYIGPKFDVDAWFQAVRTGNTFVTTGPLLEFTVNGRIPGSDIRAKLGDELRIKARALGHAVLPRYLEVVSQGDVVRAALPSTDQREVEIEFSIPVKRSVWFAARSFGAHTSPVYVHVGDSPFWKLEKVEEIIGIRLKQLDDLEELVRQGIPTGGPGGWNRPELLRKNASGLMERLAVARSVYQDLLRQAKREMSGASGSAGQ